MEENNLEENEIIKFIGDNLEVQNFVIHQLLKEAHKTEVQDKAASSLLQVNIKERKFIGELDYSYHKKSSPVYGIFAGERLGFQNELRSYYVDKSISFFDFSKRIMMIYKDILLSTVTASGGYMILCQYKKNDKDLLLVVMINNKDGFVVDEEHLTLANVRNLNVNKVDVACLINLSDWTTIENNDPTDRKTYLSFVKGLKKLSYYFMSFVDVDNKNTSTESTNRLIKAIDAYAGQQGWGRETKINQRNKVYTYCYDCIDRKKEILLTNISSILNPDNPADFEEFASEDEFKVSAIVSGDKAKMKFLRVISYKDDDLKIEFATKLLLDNKVVYSKDKNTLTIKNIPSDLQEKILELDKNAK